jgi:DNA polymerase III delta' subunit
VGFVDRKTMMWHNPIAQDRVKEMLGAAYGANTLGHAYLFCGEDGVGKFEAAFELALALLCSGEGTVPCRVCPSCRKALRNAHPDLHILTPVSLDKEHKASDGKLSPAGWDYLAGVVRQRIEVPYIKPQQSGVPTIPVEWIKEVNHALLRGPVDGLASVAIIASVDLMNKESANAMLKTLEEPPSNTFLILTTSMPQSVLPTIASRCQIVRFGLVPSSKIRDAILGAVGLSADPLAVERAAYYAMGSVTRGLELVSDNQAEAVAEARCFLGACGLIDWQEISRRIDALSRVSDYDAHARFFVNCMYLLRNEFLKIEGYSETYIEESEPVSLVRIPADPGSVEKLCAACQKALAAVTANANCGITYVNFALTVMELMNVEKQQAG